MLSVQPDINAITAFAHFFSFSQKHVPLVNCTVKDTLQFTYDMEAVG